ncbi:MAG: hypothetical protein CL804_09710 [Citromicrobium sp.]|nr:hypothetical protein [Citromicrobium sp.]|tara:strand:+ start:6405 stop:6743 length:339 start_codon:yes stop_codon:yes gene_type:complete
MLTIPTIAQRLSRSLADAEAGTDDALLKTSSVMSEVVTARIAFRDHEAAVHAQPALLRIQKATSDLISAQGELLRAHGELKKALVVTGGPAEGDCPDWDAMASTTGQPRAVA